jgi:hypothetical protein
VRITLPSTREWYLIEAWRCGSCLGRIDSCERDDFVQISVGLCNSQLSQFGKIHARS